MAQTVRRIVGPTILCRSGAYFDFENPEASDFTIEDVAHGLAHICRFNGHCQRFYSVAEHSVHVSSLVPFQYSYSALMHDAPEAFVGDVPKPLKAMLPDYRRIEERVESAVLSRFNVSLPLHPCVKQADVAMLRAEQAQAMGNCDEWGGLEGIEPPMVLLGFWSPEEARARFIDQFERLAWGKR